MSESVNPTVNPTVEGQTGGRHRKLSPTVVVRNVSKQYLVKSEKRRIGMERFEALHDANFVAHEGESIGLLGHNGSGKSTMLRMIAGSEEPTKGSIYVKSRPSLMGVTAALQPRLSGAKNVRIGCLAMGMTPQEADVAYQEIVDFADIGSAIDRPMNTYSSGQGARLRFAIGTAMAPEILLVDEALSTGDGAFAKVAQRRVQSIIENAGTFFLVSHAPRQVEEMCERAIWIHEGNIIADGPSDRICGLYNDWMKAKGDGNQKGVEVVLELARADYKKPIIYFE